MAKTENDFLLVKQSPGERIQLSLPLPVESEPWRRFRTPEQEQDFQNVLEGLRLDANKKLTWCNNYWKQKGYCWKKLQDVPNKEFSIAMDAYWEAHPNEKPKSVSSPIQSKTYKPRPYRPWTTERKWRNRLRLLELKGRNRFSLIDLYVSYIQDKITNNPQYFGVCPLPEVNRICNLNLQDYDENKIRAINKEIQLREIERGELHPLAIPLSIKTPVKELEVAFNKHQTINQ